MKHIAFIAVALGLFVSLCSRQCVKCQFLDFCCDPSRHFLVCKDCAPDPWTCCPHIYLNHAVWTVQPVREGGWDPDTIFSNLGAYCEYQYQRCRETPDEPKCVLIGDSIVVPCDSCGGPVIGAQCP